MHAVMQPCSSNPGLPCPGSQTRLRGIRNGPAYGGKAQSCGTAALEMTLPGKKDCDPKLNETRTCAESLPCPIHCQPRPRSKRCRRKRAADAVPNAPLRRSEEEGEVRVQERSLCSLLSARWSLWEAWSTCSRSCNGGTYTRQRVEQVGPQWPPAGASSAALRLSLSFLFESGSCITWRPLLLGLRGRRRRLQRSRSVELFRAELCRTAREPAQSAQSAQSAYARLSRGLQVGAPRSEREWSGSGAQQRSRSLRRFALRPWSDWCFS